MKILAVTLLALVAVASSKNIDFDDLNYLEDLTAYDYHNKIGIPLADEIRRAEETQQVSRITNGSPAFLGQFPYQVGLIIDLINGQSVCGGVIINERRVLTAAHCWFDGNNQAWRITAVAGSITLFYGGQRLQSTDVVVHQSWNPSLLRDDITMIKLPSPFSFSSTVAPIALPSGSQLDELFVGEMATASGFGRTGDGNSDGIGNSQILSYVNLPIIPNAECWRSFPLNVVGSNICVSGAGAKSTCSGDSGGPLAIMRNNRPLLVGLTSFGSDKGCSLGFPVAFVRITSYMSWINSH